MMIMMMIIIIIGWEGGRELESAREEVGEEAILV